MRRTSLALLAACALGACVDGPISDDELDSGSQAISYDTGHDDVDTPVANATVHLSTGCSGTLVSPTQVLTAAHCVFMEPGPDEPRAVVTGAVVGNRMFVADARGKLFVIRVDGDKYRRPWSVTSLPTPARVDVAAGLDRTMYIVAGGVLYEAAEGTTMWISRGAAPVTRLAASPTTLWGLDADGWLVRRARSAAVEPFERVERMPSGVVGIAADVDGRPYLATSEGRLRAQVDGVWRDIGRHPGMAMFGNGDYLFARDPGGTLWMRRAVPWEHEWRNIGYAGNYPIAATFGRLHGFTAARTHLERDVRRRYVFESDLPFTPVALAATATATSNDLFAIDDASRLRVRAIAGGEWTDLGPTPTGIQFRGLTFDGTHLLAATSWGVLRRAPTRSAASWLLTTGNERTDLRALTVTSGRWWGLTTSGRLVWRAASGGAWTEVTGEDDEAIPHPFLGTYAGWIWTAIDPLSWPLRAEIAQLEVGKVWFQTEPHVDWQSPLRFYRNQREVWIKLGHDRRTLPSDEECRDGHARCARSYWYRHSGEADMAVLELDRPIAPEVATPATPMTQVPDGIELANEWFYVRGWGETNFPSGARQLRWNGSAWTETFALHAHATEIAFDAQGGAMLTIDGDVFRIAAGAWQLVDRFPTAVSVASMGDGNRTLIAEPRAIRLHDAHSGSVWTHATPSLADGEAIRAIAFEGTRLFVSTTRGRLFTRVAGGSFAVENSYAFDSLAADATDLYGLTSWGAIVRRPLTGGAWTTVGYGRLADGIAAHAGVLQGVQAGMPRFRQVGYGWSMRYPYVWQTSPEDPARFRLDGARTMPGDSGGSCLWEDEAGRLHLVGVTQGLEHAGGRFTATFSGSERGTSTAPVPNLAAWIDHVVGLPQLDDPIVVVGPSLDPGTFDPDWLPLP